MVFKKIHFWIFKLLIISSLCAVSCKAQVEEPFPFILKKYEEVDSQLTQHLLIPFLENGKYGLADYEGNIKLTPQFSQIEMINLAYPFFWAGEKDAMTLRNKKGKEVLDFKNRPIKKTKFTRFEQLEWYTEDTPKYDLLLRILANEEEAKKNSKKARYFYLNEKTKAPLQSYFLQNYDHLKEFYRTHRLQYFQSDNAIDSNVKVMTEDGKFTFLDKNGNQIIAPNFGCYLLTDDKIILYRKDGLAALKDLKSGWQTDFLFKLIQTTPDPNIFTAEFFNKKDRTTSKFIIGKKGKVTQLDVMNSERWKILNDQYTFCQKKSAKDKYNYDYWLMDNNTFTKIKDLPTGVTYEVFDTYGFDFSTDPNEKRFVTLEGDTLLKPIAPIAVNMNKTVYKFSKNKKLGIADKDGNVLLEIDAKQMSYRSDKTVELRKDKNWGWANANGKIILPLEYDKIEFFEDVNRVIVMKDKKYGLYDLDGNEILPMTYRSISPDVGTIGYGMSFRLNNGEKSFVVSPKLELIKGWSFFNPINKKSMYAVKSDSEEIQQDFATAQRPIILTNYIIFVGKTHTHIFRSDKKYVASIKGRCAGVERGIYVGKISNYKMGTRFSGMLEVNRDEKKVWVRLKDGYIFEQ